MRVILGCDWQLKYAVCQTAGLARHGADVVLLCRTHAHEFADDTSERAEAIDVARNAGVEVIEVGGRLSDMRMSPKLASIRWQLSRFAPDVVHVHEGIDPRSLAVLPRGLTVLTIHDPVLHPGQPVPPIPKRWLLHAAGAAWRARADAIIVHSERLKADVRRRRSQQCVAIPHGLEVTERALLPPRQPTVGFFGRLEPYKGLEVLARAMPRVWRIRPDVQLKVAGTGEAELPLNDSRVHRERRYIPERDVARFFATSSLVVLPYTQASQTGVGSRAVGFGVPVIASRVGGLPELTLDDSYVFPPGDDAALATAIVSHIEDGADIRDRVLGQVAAPRSWDMVGKRTLELYEGLLQER